MDVSSHWKLPTVLIVAIVTRTLSTLVPIESTGDFPDSLISQEVEQGSFEPRAAALHVGETWDNFTASKSYPEESPEVDISLLPSSIWTLSLQIGASGLAVFLICGVFSFAEYYQDFESVLVALPPPQLKPVRNEQAIQLAVGMFTMVIDSTISALIVPLLPELCDNSGATVLFFGRLVIALFAVLVLPARLRHDTRSGHLMSGVGLFLLAVSCCLFSCQPSFTFALLGQIVGAVASAAIFVSAAYTTILEADAQATPVVGRRLCTVFAGIAIGYACGPWLGSTLQTMLSIPHLLMLFACIAVLACCVHLFIRTYGAVHHGSIQFRTAQDTLPRILSDRRCLTLLWGAATGSSVLALHSVAMPLYLATFTQIDARILDSWQGFASALVAISMFGAGFAFDRLKEQYIVRGMMVALMLSILGLRSVTMVPVIPECIAIGLMASLGGIGLYLGLSLPLYIRRASNKSDASHMCTIDVACVGLLGAAWYLGDALGAAFQMLLHPLLGLRWTILSFTSVLVLHGAAVMLGPAWQSHASQQKANIHGQLSRVEQRL